MKKYVLGAGITGLAASYASGMTVFEAARTPGGICSSYFQRPGHDRPMVDAPADGEAYRFETGGGHWIFGGDPAVIRFLERFGPMKRYARKSSVYFREGTRYVPYPIQNHLCYLGAATAHKAMQEVLSEGAAATTMAQWLKSCFGPTLCDLFFYPFHELYTAGLYHCITPQDAYKTPIDRALVKAGASGQVQPVGYNVNFKYPQAGLSRLARAIADLCPVQYGRTVCKLDVFTRRLFFETGESLEYDLLVSTLPLNRILEMTDIDPGYRPDPFTSVLVLNIGAVRGAHCPEDHWLYVPASEAGFYRIGFYSNVDASFLPASARPRKDRVAIYVESAYPGGQRPDDAEIERYSAAVVAELQSWGFIETLEVVDPTWIDVAYTWSWPGSPWKDLALEELEKHDIYQVGRYGRWSFQGIADSIRDGLMVGAALK